MKSKFKKSDVINKYTKRYGNPVDYMGHTYYLTEYPELKRKKLNNGNIYLYYNAASVCKDELMQSVPDARGIVDLSEYEVIWDIYDCYINSCGNFYELEDNEVGKKPLNSVEDACDWDNPSRVIKW